MLGYFLWTIPFLLVSLPFFVTWLFPCNAHNNIEEQHEDESEWVLVGEQRMEYQAHDRIRNVNEV